MGLLPIYGLKLCTQVQVQKLENEVMRFMCVSLLNAAGCFHV